MNNNIIEIRDLNFEYNRKIIFSSFNLNIKKGTSTTIIGSNNSGKSTLIKILCGLLEYNGYINIDGYLLNKNHLKEIRRNMGIVFEDTNNQFVSETVMDDLAFSLENLQYKKSEITTAIKNISKLFKIEELLELNPLELTNSDKQKVAIASSLIHNPKILILDNALHQLTPKDKISVFKILKKYQEDYKLTIILITNNLEDTLYFDNLIVLDKGKIYLEGTTKDVYLEENKLNRLSLKLPFVIDLSYNLKLYDVIDNIYLNMEDLVDAIWK